MRKVVGTAGLKEIADERRRREASERERRLIVERAAAADDRRYLDTVGWRHRLVVKLFRKHFAWFSKAAIAAAADREIISTAAAHALARSVENRLDQGEG